MIPGKRFTLADGKEYILPPLTFAQVREADEEGLTAPLLDKANPKGAVAAAFLLIHRALVQNHPDLKPEAMERLLDPGLVEAIVPVLMFGKVKYEDRAQDPPRRQ